MSASAIPIHEFSQEMATTRRLLERVSAEHGPWKPHPKSFALGHLAQLISWMPGWITNGLRESELDLSGGGNYSFEPTEVLLAHFDANVAEAEAALQEVTGPELHVPWSLRMDDRILLTLPRREITRLNLSHLIHHRGQLTVYLRLLDVPIPPIYGPTADESW